MADVDQRAATRWLRVSVHLLVIITTVSNA